MNGTLRSLINSRLAFRLLIAIPAIVMLSQYVLSGGGLGQVLQSSGEWAARMLVLTLAVTPLRMLFKGRHWPLWLFKRRRDLGVAAFLYALLHLGSYVARQSSLNVILYDMSFIEYLPGWLGFAAMAILFVTSNDWALHRLGTAWKKIQRLVYAAAVLAFLHWLWIRLDNVPAYAHFVPLAALETFRLWYNFARPSRRRLPE